MMTSLYRRLASFPLVTALAGGAAAVVAFTDENADMKEAAADRSERRAVIAKAATPKATIWVPLATAKQLDGFKPVLPPGQLQQAGPQAPVRATQALAAR